VAILVPGNANVYEVNGTTYGKRKVKTANVYECMIHAKGKTANCSGRVLIEERNGEMQSIAHKPHNC
jgi:hypothetical protein